MFKNKTFYGVVGTAIILLTLGIYASGKSRLTNKSTSPTPSPTIVAKNVPEGWNTYSSNSLGFAIGRPADMEAVEHSDKTVTFVLLGLNQSKEADLTNATSINFANYSYQGNFKGSKLRRKERVFVFCKFLGKL